MSTLKYRSWTARAILLTVTDHARTLRVLREYPQTALPGIFALLGASAFFAGVSRLTFSLLVILIEMANDVHFVLPMMVAVIVAKRIADQFVHGAVKFRIDS